MNYEIIKLANENKQPLDEAKVLNFLRDKVGLSTS